jgi:hypothetical protein
VNVTVLPLAVPAAVISPPKMTPPIMSSSKRSSCESIVMDAWLDRSLLARKP